jgi:hypothetical protein
LTQDDLLARVMELGKLRDVRDPCTDGQVIAPHGGLKEISRGIGQVAPVVDPCLLALCAEIRRFLVGDDAACSRYRLPLR